MSNHFNSEFNIKNINYWYKLVIYSKYQNIFGARMLIFFLIDIESFLVVGVATYSCFICE
jgi:hypothetical protein